jgi:hypothetical protein
MCSAYLQAIKDCPNYDTGNVLADLLPAIEKLTGSQIDKLVAAFNENGELRGSFGFNGNKPSTFGID